MRPCERSGAYGWRRLGTCTRPGLALLLKSGGVCIPLAMCVIGPLVLLRVPDQRFGVFMEGSVSCAIVPWLGDTESKRHRSTCLHRQTGGGENPPPVRVVAGVQLGAQGQRFLCPVRRMPQALGGTQ